MPRIQQQCSGLGRLGNGTAAGIPTFFFLVLEAGKGQVAILLLMPHVPLHRIPKLVVHTDGIRTDALLEDLLIQFLKRGLNVGAALGINQDFLVGVIISIAGPECPPSSQCQQKSRGTQTNQGHSRPGSRQSYQIGSSHS